MNAPIIIAGDPHGDHKPIITACLNLDREPGTLILLGDCELEEPLRVAYAAVLDAGWTLRYIHGNHDKDREVWFDNLLTDAPDWNLHATCIEVGGLRIGGLGGVFKQSWYPRAGDEEPRWRTRDEFLRQTRLCDRWRNGLPFKRRDDIWPEDIEALSAMRLDVLVTHEAPRPHRHGFQALNLLADACGASLLIHGHHHRHYVASAVLPRGRVLHIRGLGIADPWLLEMPA